ncbi:MAG: J domain-containing protein [Treponema sp.]|jgi:curved DNA-binding protein CbpA|nr:J domain-containing protein [Treponema sp.]
MKNSRNIFYHEINEFITSSKNIRDKDRIKQKYLDLVKKYHPDVNNKIDKNILNEYMVIINNSYEEIMSNTVSKTYINTENNNIGSFNFSLFMLLLGKITEKGINKETIKDKIFLGYKNLLITEIEKSSKDASEAFKLLFSDKIIIKYSEKIDLFNNGIMHYVNKQEQEIADSYLAEYKDNCKKKEEKNAIEVLQKWYKEAHEAYQL